MVLQRPPRLVIIAVLLVSSACHGLVNNTSFQDNFLSIASAHCQTVDYCGRNLETTPETQKDGKYQPCCTACSCNEDCNETSNCCFPFNGTQSNPPLQKCYTPTTHTEKDVHMHVSYHMVDQCPDHKHPDAACGNTKVAPWGSMMPVYSNSQGKIFKNMVCARCHAVDDAEVWLAYLTCRAHKDNAPGSSTAIVAYIETFRSGILGYGCFVSFTPPDTIKSEDIQAHECFDVKVSTCNNGENFEVPYWSTLFKREIIENCEGEDIGTFTGFISMLSLNKLFKDEGPVSDETVLTCKIADPTVCRQVLCPVGQLYNSQGTCIYPYPKWNASPYNLHLTLIPKEKFRYSKKPANVNDLGYDIKTPLSNTWVLKTFYYQLNGNTHESENDILWFLVYYQRPQPINNAPDYFRFLEKLLEGDWVVNYSGYQYTCHAEFARTFLYAAYFGEITPYWKLKLKDNQTSSIPHENGTIISLLTTLEAMVGFNINRLNFCYHIQLQKKELLYINHNIVQDIDSGKYFFDNEFIEVLDHNGYPVIRVCQEDLGYSIQAAQTTSSFSETDIDSIGLFVPVVLAQAWLITYM